MSKRDGTGLFEKSRGISRRSQPSLPAKAAPDLFQFSRFRVAPVFALARNDDYLLALVLNSAATIDRIERFEPGAVALKNRAIFFRFAMWFDWGRNE
jgi:hypothetical protein